MRKFEGVLIVTDLDGTLLRNDKSLSEENLRAIRYFQKEGGLFSFVTGRVPRGAKAVAETVKPNAPCGHGNGGVIYDHVACKTLWSRTLPASAVQLVEDTAAHFPTVGVILCTEDTAYFQRRNAASDKFRSDEGFDDVTGNICTITEPLTKAMFVDNDEQTLLAVAAYLAAHPLAEEFYFIRTDAAYYEALPKGVSKGGQIARLSDLTGVPVSRIIAVGDNDNDASMLKAAGVGVAVANASAAAKRAADRVTVSNEEHAIARIIKELDEELWV